ncbi:hypothetical protein DE146DRAFT_781165 [Phaeosphaeria sp. MPI-PUGE-AT-0046c]|nr:hypothetical protein DE146DRAFT_781165 [Phaeosphaeria sp. MPI-PUGE-AT-0046c]
MSSSKTTTPTKAGSSSHTTSPSGDGGSLQSPAWSAGIRNNPSANPQYLVDDIVSSPRYIRVTLSEAVAMQNDGKKVYDVSNLQQIPKGQLPSSATGTSGPSSQAFESQSEEIANVENTVSASGGDLAEAYDAAQVHHGDVLADSDRENTGNSSETSAVRLRRPRLVPPRRIRRVWHLFNQYVGVPPFNSGFW